MTGQPNIDPKTGHCPDCAPLNRNTSYALIALRDGTFFYARATGTGLEYDTGNRKDLALARTAARGPLASGLRVRLRHCGCCLLRGMDAAPRGKTSDFRSDHRQVGKDAHAADRQGYRLPSGYWRRPSFMVQNAATRPIGSSSLISAALDRNAVIGSPLADVVFALCDLVYLADPE